MSRSNSLLYSDIGLSSDEDFLVEEEETVAVTSSRTPGRSRTKAPYCASPLSSSMKAQSKYDYKPRNMEFDGDKFVAACRQSSGSERRDKRRSAAAESNAVSFAEFEVQSLSLEGRGQSTEVEGQDHARESWWLGVGKMEKWQVVALGCFMGLLLGILYRGGLGGLYLGLFPEGKDG